MRAAFTRVDHIHVFAPASALAERYRSRGDSSGLAELAGYAEVACNETEGEVHSLASDADVAIDTRNCSEASGLSGAVHGAACGRQMACGLALHVTWPRSTCDASYLIAA